VARPKTGGPKKGVGFGFERFVYDKVFDCYVCLCGVQLGFRGLYHRKGRVFRV